MDIDDTQESRLMARGIPSDDPSWGQVSAFLTDVESTYSNAGVASLEASHLAAISRELRLLQAEPRLAQRKTMNSFLKLKTHRVLLGSLLSALVALTAGVGVAAAMGGDALKQLVPASQPEVTPTPEESPTAESTEAEEAEDHSATADDEQEKADQSGRHESEDSNDDSDDQTADDSDSDDSEDSDSDDSSEHAQPSDDSDDSGDDSDEAQDDSDDDSHGSDQSGDQSVDDEPGEH